MTLNENVRRIKMLAGDDFDLNSDEQVVKILRRKFNIYLPQRSSLFEALRHTNSDHEIVHLLLQHRAGTGSSSASEALRH